MPLDYSQIQDKSPRSKIGSVIGDNLSNQLTLIDDHFLFPLDVSIQNNVIFVTPSSIQKVESNGQDSTQDSYKWRGMSNLNGPSTNAGTLSLSNGAVSGDLQTIVCPTVTANYFIQLGLEVRANGLIYGVWGSQSSTINSTTPPIFTKGMPQLCVIKLQKNGTTGTWGFVDTIKSNIEIIRHYTPINQDFGSQVLLTISTMSKSITFPTTILGNYVVVANFINTVDPSPMFQPIVITSTNSTGFIAKWNAPLDSGNYYLNYIVITN